MNVIVESALPRAALPPENEIRHPLRCVALHWRGHVGVDLAGDVGAAVVETLADDLDVDSGAQRERGLRVT